MEVDQDLDLKISPYDPMPKYLIDLKMMQPKKQTESASIPNLEDNPQAAEKPPSKLDSSSDSEASSCSCSEAEEEQSASGEEEEQPTSDTVGQDEINEDAYTEEDPAYAE